MNTNTVRVRYNGTAFIPIEPCDVIKGTIIDISFAQESLAEAKNASNVKAFKDLMQEIHELNQEEPLPDNFFEIVNTKVNLNREVDL